MSLVGIIANPAAGKDIRRLVAHASTFDNHQKVNIVRRVLLALDAAGVSAVVLMPDAFGIGARALDGLKLSLDARVLDMPVAANAGDTTRAAEHMRALGATCLVTLGGDGTNRAVARACGSVPLVPVSTGTNNVFPIMIEGTVAGLAAAVVALGVVPLERATQPTPRLEILRDGEMADLALVDVIVYDGQFVGARAIWDTAGIRQIVLSRADAPTVGFSSIGGNLGMLDGATGEGMVIETGGDGKRVLAPIAPGLVRWIPIAAHRRLAFNESVAVAHTPAVLALDGEREIVVDKGEHLAIRLSQSGPLVVNVPATLRAAAANGFFVRGA